MSNHTITLIPAGGGLVTARCGCGSYESKAGSTGKAGAAGRQHVRQAMGTGRCARPHTAPLPTEWRWLIRARREALGLTQRDVARMLGTTQGQVGNIEQGQRDPLTSTTLRLFEVLGLELVPVDREAAA